MGNKIKKAPVLVAKFFQLLNSRNVNYAILRNHEGLPEYYKSRDIDIIIDKKQFLNIRKEIKDTIEDEKFMITTYFESERIHTFVCGKISKGGCELLQLDFFFHTSAYGTILLDKKQILDSRVFENGIYHVSKEYEFLDKYLYLKYLGYPYPSKYAYLREKVKHSKCLDSILTKEFGINSLQELEQMNTSDLKKITKCKLSINRLKNKLDFYKWYLQNLLVPRGFSLGFTGPDGAGKTAVADRVMLELGKVYPRILIFHHRPALIGNLGEVAHRSGLKNEIDRQFDKPHRGSRKGIVNSILRLAYYSTDYVAGYFIKVRIHLQKRSIIIFDRYYTDTICDSQRSSIYLSHKFLYWFGRLFIPSLRYNILLTADSQTILERKQELNKEGIDAINHKIDYLATKKGYYKILNEGTPQEAVEKILQIIFEEQHKMNIKRL